MLINVRSVNTKATVQLDYSLPINQAAAGNDFKYLTLTFGAGDLDPKGFYTVMIRYN